MVLSCSLHWNMRGNWRDLHSLVVLVGDRHSRGRYLEGPNIASDDLKSLGQEKGTTVTALCQYISMETLLQRLALVMIIPLSSLCSE